MCGVSAQLTTIDAPTAIVCGVHCHCPAVSKLVYCSSCRVLSKGLIQLNSRRPSGASDMSGCAAPAPAGSGHSTRVLPAASVVVSGCGTCWQPASSAQTAIAAMDVVFMRSDEHTSELQSLMRISYAVFCLNKKTNT